jgi:HSP20 family protein
VNLLREERRFGKFYRSFKVNTRVQSDNIEADYKNGLLTINLPKAVEIKPKEIKVKVGK